MNPNCKSNVPDQQETNQIKQGALSANESQALWHCDTYCRKVRYITCEGRAFADPSSPNRCPYLDEMLY
ncbi:MAG: hypothetical protein LUC90_07385 [Lachnospiraceae bacterium]|nr:hypothetical protein [Lachnospiraceae bacterium]